MSKRSGSATPRKDEATNTWWFVVDAGRGADGKRRQIKRRGFAKKSEAQAALDQLRVKVTGGEKIPAAKLTVADYLERWMATQRHELRASTFESYERNLRVHVLPRIGGRQLRTVDGLVLNTMYVELLEQRADGKPGGLAPRTVRYVHTILSKAFRDGVRTGHLARNPCDAATPPSPGKVADSEVEMRTWTGEQLGDFLAELGDDRYRVPFLALATMGCRRGELLGLRWCDVDLEEGAATIRQTLGAVAHRPVIQPTPKTRKVRTIGLDAVTVAELRSWRARRAEERMALGQGWDDDALVFCHADGRLYHPERFSREFDRRLERMPAYPKIRLHDLRHTWATLALEGGEQLKVVSERLGHSRIGVTADIYQHVSPAVQRDAAERVSGMIFGRL